MRTIGGFWAYMAEQSLGYALRRRARAKADRAAFIQEYPQFAMLPEFNSWKDTFRSARKALRDVRRYRRLAAGLTLNQGGAI